MATANVISATTARTEETRACSPIQQQREKLFELIAITDVFRRGLSWDNQFNERTTLDVLHDGMNRVAADLEVIDGDGDEPAGDRTQHDLHDDVRVTRGSTSDQLEEALTLQQQIARAHDDLMKAMSVLSCIEHALPQDADEDEPCSRIAVRTVYGQLGEIGSLLERAMADGEQEPEQPDDEPMAAIVRTLRSDLSAIDNTLYVVMEALRGQPETAEAAVQMIDHHAFGRLHAAEDRVKQLEGLLTETQQKHEQEVSRG